MRRNPAYATTEPAAVRDLVRENPWATIVSDNAGPTGYRANFDL